MAIRDTGKGIDLNDLDAILDPGFTTKKVGVGTGLGLSICHQIGHQHRGRIEVNSRVGEGTVFAVTVGSDPPLSGGS